MKTLTGIPTGRYSSKQIAAQRAFIEYLEQHRLPEAVAETPGPHYVTSYQVSEDHMSITAEVLFPRVDPTLGSRIIPIEHANQTHHMLAAWNAAHVLRQLHGAFGILARRSSIDTPEVTLLDVPCRAECKIVRLDETKVEIELEGQMFKVQGGVFQGAFYQDKGKGEVCVADTTTHFAAFFK